MPFFSHTRIDCPPIIFLGLRYAKSHTVYIVKTKTFHLSLSIFPLFFGDKNSDTKPLSFKLFDRFKGKQIFGFSLGSPPPRLRLLVKTFVEGELYDDDDMIDSSYLQISQIPRLEVGR